MYLWLHSIVDHQLSLIQSSYGTICDYWLFMAANEIVKCGSSTFIWQRLHWLLWTGLRAACGKISVIHSHLNYYGVFIMYTQFADMTACCRVETLGVKGLFKWETLKQPKLLQLEKVLQKWFTAMCLEEKPVTGAMINQKVKSLYDEMKITDKFTFSEGWLRTFKQPAPEVDIQI